MGRTRRAFPILLLSEQRKLLSFRQSFFWRRATGCNGAGWYLGEERRRLARVCEDEFVPGAGDTDVEQAALLCMRVSMNKKEYIKLEARIVALPMKENIAASGVPVPPDIPDHGDVFVGDDDVFEND